MSLSGLRSGGLRGSATGTGVNGAGMRWPPSARLGGASYALKPEPAGPRGAAGMILIDRT